MRRHAFYALAIMVLLSVLLTNEYMKIEYDINIVEYFDKSETLTREELQWLDAHEKISYGSDQSSPPLRYIDERNGQYRGLIVDYIRALSIEIKHEISFEPVEVWGDAFNSLKNNEKDFFDMIPSKGRADQFDFTDTIYTLQGVILKSIEDIEIQKYTDLTGKRVAIPTGDYAIEFLSSKSVEIELVETKNIENAMTLLNLGRVDAVVGDEPVITYILDKLEMKDGFETTEAIYKEGTALAVQKSEQTLLSILNKGIFSLKKKHVMSDLQQKWFGISSSFSNQDDSGKLGLLSFGFLAMVGIIAYMAYAWNVTLKKEVDKRTQELYLSRQKLKVTFDGLTNLMVVIDEQERIINVNKAFCDFVGCGGKKPYGSKISKYDELFRLDEVKNQIEKTFRLRDQHRTELRFNNKTYVISTFPLSEKYNSEKSILIMFDDITRVKVAEQRLLQDNKMQSMGVLAAGVAHEIRNPLGLIGHYSYILRTNKMNDPARQEKAISVIESSVERASHIIDNLLNFSRMTSDDVRELSVRRFIENIIELENKDLKTSGIDCELSCDPELICGVRQEPLKHIVMNLISNAIAAMPDKGTLEIKCFSNDQKLTLVIGDNGVGIPHERLEDIFTPFYTTKDPGKGTGLGLYIVYNEVTKYGGSIEVDSELNIGTTFTVELPIVEGV